MLKYSLLLSKLLVRFARVASRVSATLRTSSGRFSLEASVPNVGMYSRSGTNLKD